MGHYKRTALVLGVGAAQCDLILRLKRAGWHVVGCSYRHEGAALEDVDEFALVDIVDQDRVEQLARNIGADLVYSIGSDVAMPVVAEVAERMGMPAPIAAATARLMQNKGAFRAFLNAEGISPVRHRTFRSPSEIEDWDCFPAIVKPVDSQGQRGVMRVLSAGTLAEEAARALEASRSGEAIIEEFLDGPEISVNAFVLNGETVVQEISDRIVRDDGSGAPSAHVYPSRHTTATQAVMVRDLVRRSNAALELRSGPVYYQIKLTAAGPRIIEAAPRLDGCHLWRLIAMCGGVDLLQASIDVMVGESPTLFKPTPGPAPLRLDIFYGRDGELFTPSRFDVAEGTVFEAWYFAEGESMRAISGASAKAGYAIRPDSVPDRQPWDRQREQFAALGPLPPLRARVV